MIHLCLLLLQFFVIIYFYSIHIWQNNRASYSYMFEYYNTLFGSALA